MGHDYYSSDRYYEDCEREEKRKRIEGMVEIHEHLGCDDAYDLGDDNSKTIYGMISSLQDKVNSLEEKMDKILSILKK